MVVSTIIPFGMLEVEIDFVEQKPNEKMQECGMSE